MNSLKHSVFDKLEIILIDNSNVSNYIKILANMICEGLLIFCKYIC